MVLRKLLTFKQVAEVLGFESADPVEEIAGTPELPVVLIKGRGQRPNKRIESEALEAFIARNRSGGEPVLADMHAIKQADRMTFALATQGDKVAAERVPADAVEEAPVTKRRAPRKSKAVKS